MASRQSDDRRRTSCANQRLTENDRTSSTHKYRVSSLMAVQVYINERNQWRTEMVTHAVKALSLAGIWIASVSMAPIPVVNLAELVHESDFVVVGRVAAIVDGGSATMAGGGAGRRLESTIVIDDVIKGSFENSSIDVTFIQPDEPVGFRGVVADTYGIFFLRRAAGGVRFTSPYYPYLIALPGFRSSGQSPIDRAVDVIGNVLRSGASAASQAEAIWALRGSDNPTAVAALKTSMRDTNREIALRSAAALLSAGDLAGLPVIASALEQNRVGISDETYLTALGSLTEVSQPAAAATLERLLARGDVGTRRATIQSLRKLGLLSAAPAFIQSLDDDDVEVRHHAVMALAELTRQNEWGPSIDAFTADERRYITHWKEWAKERK